MHVRNVLLVCASDTCMGMVHNQQFSLNSLLFHSKKLAEAFDDYLKELILNWFYLDRRVTIADIELRWASPIEPLTSQASTESDYGDDIDNDTDDDDEDDDD